MMAAKRLPQIPHTGAVTHTHLKNRTEACHNSDAEVEHSTGFQDDDNDDDDDLIGMIKRMIIQDQRNDKLLVEHLVDDVMFYKSEIRQKNELIGDLMHCLKSEIDIIKRYLLREDSVKVAPNSGGNTTVEKPKPTVVEPLPIITDNNSIPEIIAPNIVGFNNDDRILERDDNNNNNNDVNSDTNQSTIGEKNNERNINNTKTKLMLRRTSHWHVNNENESAKTKTTTDDIQDARDQTRTSLHTDFNDNEEIREPNKMVENDNINISENDDEKEDVDEESKSAGAVINEKNNNWCNGLAHRVGKCNNELCETTTSELSADCTTTDQETDDVISSDKNDACAEQEVFNRACVIFNRSVNDEDETNEIVVDTKEVGEYERVNSSSSDSPLNFNSQIVKSQLEALRQTQRDKYYANKMLSNDDGMKWQEDTILVVGDSILCGIDEQRLGKKKFVKVRVFPGARLDDFFRYLPPLLDKCPSHIILHGGTNDAPHWTSNVIADKMLKIISFVKSILPMCDIIISYPVLRMDEAKASLTVRKLRSDLNALCLPCITHDNITEKHLGKKGFHLNARGLGRIALNILACIRRL